MSNAPRKSSWKKKLGITIGALVGLVIIAYFVATSAWAVKTFVLPPVTAAIGAEVTVEDAGISPFSSVTLTGLKVRPGAAEPLVAAREVRLRYRLMDILGGNINVDEVTLDSPVIKIVINADGTTSFDPILKTLNQNSDESALRKDSGSEPPPRVNIRSIALRNATIQFTRIVAAPAGREEGQLTGVNLTVSNIKNGGTATVGLEGQLAWSVSTPGGLSELATRFSGSYTAALADDLQPQPVKGTTELSITTATGTFSDLRQVTGKFESEFDSKQILQKFYLTRGAEVLGNISLAARYDLAQGTVTGRLDVDGVGASTLALVGSRLGIGFGSTVLGAHYDFAVGNRGETVTINGTFQGERVSLTRDGVTTPTLDLLLTNHLSLDRKQSNAVLRSLALTARQAGRPVLTAALSRTMSLNWGSGAGAPEESSLDVTLSRFELAPWRAFLPPTIALSAGVADGRIQIDARQSGQLLGLRLQAALSEVTGKVADNQLQNAAVSVDLSGVVAALNDATISNLVVRVQQAGRELATVTASGHVDAAKQNVNLQTAVQVSLADASRLLGRPDVALTAGSLNFTGRIRQDNLSPQSTNVGPFNRRVTGDLQVSGLSGAAAGNRFDRFDTTFNLDVVETNQLVEILRAEGVLRQAGQAGGQIAATGRFDAARKKGRGQIKITDLNQTVLQSFLAGVLGDNTLTTGAITTDLDVNYDAAAESHAKGTVRLANVLITDPQGRLPRVPLTAGVDLDAVLSAKGLAELRQFKGEILQGNQPAGRFIVTGRYDLTNRTGTGALRLDDLNQNALKPFLASVLGERQLTEVHINAVADATVDLAGASSLKANLSVTNLVINDPTGAIPSSPLAVATALDAALRDGILELRPASLSLAPTDRAKNVLTVDGRVDMRNPGAIAGDVLLSAETLDLTPYYNLFADRPLPTNVVAAQPGQPGPRATGPGSPATANVEPPAIALPLSNFTFRASIGRLFLREVDLAGFTNQTRIDGGRVAVNPLVLSINGAPVTSSALLNLGVPGYEYDTTFKAVGIPLEPLVNSFAVSLRDKLKGQLYVESAVRGAGVTGTSLRQKLEGRTALLVTNATVTLPDPSVKMPKALGGFLVTMSDVLRPIGPTIGISLDEFLKAPITWTAVNTEASSGVITLQRAVVNSDAFRISSAGTISIADDLMTSPINKLPVEVALSRALAAKAGLPFSASSTNDSHATITPNFISVGGTLKKVKVEQDKAALAIILARSGLGRSVVPANVTDGANAILGAGKTNPAALIGGINSLLGGNRSTNTTGSTNAPAQKKDDKKKGGGLLNLFK